MNEERKTADSPAGIEPINFARKRVVVTGGAGFLGRVVVRRLAERGCASILVPRRASCDLSRSEDVAALLDSAQPDIIIHLAASVDSAADAADSAASFVNNILMATHLIDAGCRRGIEKMLCVGSASSYPAAAAIPLREEELFNGLPDASRIAHGIAKRLPLVHAQACRARHGFSCVFVIPTNLYGPGDNFDPRSCYVIPSFIRKFVEAAESGAPEVVLRGTGQVTRDFLHVDDCAEGILLALERYDAAEPVNLGSGVETRVDELAREIARLAGYSGTIVWDGSPSDGPARRLLDITRARKFGFVPRRELASGLRETLEWFQGQVTSGERAQTHRPGATARQLDISQQPAAPAAPAAHASVAAILGSKYRRRIPQEGRASKCRK